MGPSRSNDGTLIFMSCKGTSEYSKNITHSSEARKYSMCRVRRRYGNSRSAFSPSCFCRIRENVYRIRESWFEPRGPIWRSLVVSVRAIVFVCGRKVSALVYKRQTKISVSISLTSLFVGTFRDKRLPHRIISQCEIN